MKTINWNGYTFCENGIVLNKDGSIKQPHLNKKGYPITNFYYNEKGNTHLIHKIFAHLFLGNCPEGYEVDHIDNVRTNCKPSNLRYVTKSENNQKAYDSGNRNVSGFNNANNKYTQEQLSLVCELLNKQISYGKIEKVTGVRKGTVAKIAQGKHFVSETFRD